MPVANTTCFILDEHLNHVPIGVVGELYLGGSCVARGYLYRPDLTSDRFIANPFATEKEIANGYTRLYKTGDLCRWREDGNIEYVGRRDFQVKLRGYRIELGEIEHVLRRLLNVEHVVVVVKSEQLIAYIVVGAECKDSEETWRSVISKALPDYMVPGYFVRLFSLPLTPNGKLDERALPLPWDEKTNREERLPRTKFERELVEIWKRVLQRKHLGIDDDFFACGGNSLSCMALIHEMESQCNIKLSIQDFFNHSTIAKLSVFFGHQALDEAKSCNQTVGLFSIRCIKETGNGACLFMLPDVRGQGEIYQVLSECLDYPGKIYTLEQQISFKQNKGQWHKLVTAAVDNIRDVQDRGPYRLLGYSFGCFYAHLVAEYLETQGEEVNYLGLLDGLGIATLGQEKNVERFDVLLLKDLCEKIHFSWEQVCNKTFSEAMKIIKQYVKYVAKSEKIDAIIKQLDLVQYNLVLLKRGIEFGHVKAPTYLYLAENKEFTFFEVDIDPLKKGAIEKWRKLSEGSFNVRSVSGHHFNMMLPPFSEELAFSIRKDISNL